MDSSFLTTLSGARYAVAPCLGQGGAVVGQSAVLKSDQEEEDIVMGRQPSVGCQSPSKVQRAFMLGGGSA